MASAKTDGFSSKCTPAAACGTLPGASGGPRINRWASRERRIALIFQLLSTPTRVLRTIAPTTIVFITLLAGCSQQSHPDQTTQRASHAMVVVVAPVLNLSGSPDVDPLKVTDILATELATFENVAVIPVNLVLAELQRREKNFVDSPEDALALADAFHADATIVTAITDYRPYDPPIVALVMQWYDAAGRWTPHSRFDPVTASRSVTETDDIVAVSDGQGPAWQVQRVFNAADNATARDIEEYAKRRSGDDSVYGSKKITKSQQEYVRYCGWSMIRTMLSVSDRVADRHEGQR